MGHVKSSEIAKFLSASLVGKDLEIINISSLSQIKPFSLVFSKNKEINIDAECLVLVPLDYNETMLEQFSFIKVLNPRLSFAKVLAEFFIKKIQYTVDKSASIGNNCQIDEDVAIGKNCCIGDNVQIKKGTVINHNVVIFDNTVIGQNCYIKSGSIIGEDGFGFDFEEDGTPIRLPHIGAVNIGDNVEIGAKCTIARGTLNDTIIENNVKIDDQVFIAHNCLIGANTVITACAEISGSVIIGKNCWVGPNSSIIQKVIIGNNVTIGIGATVTDDISSNKKVMGFNALELRNLLKLKKRIDFGA